MPKEDRWIKLINEWKATDEIASQWCKKNKIHYPSFITWRKKLNQITSIKEEVSSFIEVVEEKKETCVIELKFQEITLQVKNDFDEALVRRCLKLIKSL